jgi:hypothetical protein
MDSSVLLLLSSLYTNYPPVPATGQQSFRTKIESSRLSGLIAVPKERSLRSVHGDVSIEEDRLNDYSQIDVVEASAMSGLERADLAKQISDWELDGQLSSLLDPCGCHTVVTGVIKSKASQIRAVSGR